MYVHSHDIKTSFSSHTRKIIAASLDAGRQHPSCQTCWDTESSNNQSDRQRFNKLFSSVNPYSDQPRVLVIKPGNTCNFACRMCNPVTSSKWYRDGYELEKSGLTSASWYATPRPPEQVSGLSYNEYTRTFENVRNSFNTDNQEFWNTLKDWMPGLTYIDIYGGEPFLIPGMFDVLEHGALSGASKNITIGLHTNASIFNEDYLRILGQYKSVQFRVSIDSLCPDQLAYIRHHADFDTMINNSKRFKEIILDYSSISMSITNTITPLNVFYVDRVNHELADMFQLPVNTNIVTTPEYDIRHIPIPVKDRLRQTLTNKKVLNVLSQTIPGCDVEWPKFCRTTNRLDQLRGQSFSSVFPDWWTWLEPYWIN